MASQNNCIVLVTGGAGFLGQHVVGLLQTKAQHVTEIRILDVWPYENKLDYEHSKPIKQFVGCITDIELVRQACEGVSSVIHVASIVDVSLFPDLTRMEDVNVRGTSLLLEICREVGVKRFLYCSSMAVVCGHDDIINGTEDSTDAPKDFLYKDYGWTKQRAELMVLDSNCGALRTVSIRPISMYGEEDTTFITIGLKLANKLGWWSFFDSRGKLHQMAYAGNVAWTFICAERALLQDKDNQLGGNTFFATDDTPPGNMCDMAMPFVSACKFLVLRLPFWLVICSLYFLSVIATLLWPVLKLNVPFCQASAKQLFVSYSFQYSKAKAMLGYMPLYSYEESVKRSTSYYQTFCR